MVINALLEKGLDILEKRQYSNPILEVVVLLSNLLGVDKSYIYTYGDREVPEDVEEKFLKAISLRKKGYPLQYILKEVEFMGLKFYVDEGVLIPRPDTEILVEYILNMVEKDREYTIVEIGTGSGCIALSLAHYIEKAFVYSVDIETKPLEIANRNMERLNLEDKVKLIRGDSFQGLEPLGLEGKIDIVVSNPPYIPRQVIEGLQEEVKKYEPIEALSGGEDGLDFYRDIIPSSKKYLKKGGKIALEIGFDQGESVSQLFREEGYKEIDVVKDLQGLDRVVAAIF